MAIFEYFSYPPILAGFIALVIAGTTFPLAGVFVVQLNLIPLRFMLMHASLLGGALALAFALPQTFLVPLVNLGFVAAMALLSGGRFRELHYATVFLMVLAVALASVLIHALGVPAKDTMALLWGSVFTLHIADVVQIACIGAAFVAYVLCAGTAATGVLYDKAVAVSSGIRYSLHFNAILIMLGIAVGAAMRLIGALLLDALILLPAIIGIKAASSMRSAFIYASLSGLIISVSGFMVALAADIPVSGSVTLCAACGFAAMTLFTRKRNRNEKNNAAHTV